MNKFVGNAVSWSCQTEIVLSRPELKLLDRLLRRLRIADATPAHLFSQVLISGDFKSCSLGSVDSTALTDVLFASAYSKGLTQLSARLAGVEVWPVGGNTGFASADIVSTVPCEAGGTCPATPLGTLAAASPSLAGQCILPQRNSSDFVFCAFFTERFGRGKAFEKIGLAGGVRRGGGCCLIPHAGATGPT